MYIGFFLFEKGYLGWNFLICDEGCYLIVLQFWGYLKKKYDVCDVYLGYIYGWKFKVFYMLKRKKIVVFFY